MHKKINDSNVAYDFVTVDAWQGEFTSVTVFEGGTRSAIVELDVPGVKSLRRALKAAIREAKTA